MRIDLKKSLYVGLAALSFVSVAGAANSSVSAKAHHHTRVARKAFNPDRRGMDQDQVWQANGKNNIYKTILGRHRKLVANNSNINGKYFMAYQQENNQKHQHYYKVVDFNGHNRGWIFHKGVDQTNPTSDVNTPSGHFYLNPGTKLTDYAEGSVFHNKNGFAFSHPELVKYDPFKVTKAVKINNSGDVYYQVSDQNQPTVTGWAKASDFSTNAPFDASKEIKVNLTDENGNVVKSYILNTKDYDGQGSSVGIENGYNKVLKFDQNGNANTIYTALVNALTSKDANQDQVFKGTSYKLSELFGGDPSTSNYNSSNGSDIAQSNYRALKYVEDGDTVTLKIPMTTNQVVSHLKFNTTNMGFNKSVAIGRNDVQFPKFTDDDYDVLKGQSPRQLLMPDTVFSNDKLFGNVGNGGLSETNNQFKTTDTPDSLKVLVGTQTYYAGDNGVAQGGVDAANGDSTTVFNSDFDALNDIGNSDFKPSTATKDEKFKKTVTPNFTSAVNNNAYHYIYVLNPDYSDHANSGIHYGDNLNAYYTVYAVKGAAMSNAQNNNLNTNYVG